MRQVTLLFTVHPAFPWLVTAGLILFASMMTLWIEPHLPQQAVRIRASAHSIATAASSENWEGNSFGDTQYWITPVCMRTFKVGEVVEPH